jgi:hypothetical protein
MVTPIGEKDDEMVLEEGPSNSLGLRDMVNVVDQQRMFQSID